ncbi:MAG TPA: beta-propeller fold lactonase family protein, partial [Spirochaetia bacterium]|nr:beta-propeller fold lactonase family protein [Spirochaetia bacterium]
LTIVNTPTPAGAQPTSMAMDPTGHFLYVGDGLSGAVVAFGINQSTGALSSLGTFPAGLVTSLSIDPSGAYLYATNYSGSSISEFRINPASGMLTSIGVASGLANPALVVTTSAAQ